jgi:hypothetical protein
MYDFYKGENYKAFIVLGSGDIIMCNEYDE